jgi:hypothetical protein
VKDRVDDRRCLVLERFYDQGETLRNIRQGKEY